MQILLALESFLRIRWLHGDVISVVLLCTCLGIRLFSGVAYYFVAIAARGFVLSVFAQVECVDLWCVFSSIFRYLV